MSGRSGFTSEIIIIMKSGKSKKNVTIPSEEIGPSSNAAEWPLLLKVSVLFIIEL